MGKEAKELVVDTGVLGYASRGREGDGGETEVNVDDVVHSVVVEEDGFQSAEKVSTSGGIAFIEFILEGTGWLEVLHLSTEPFGKEEGANDGEGDVRGHP